MPPKSKPKPKAEPKVERARSAVHAFDASGNAFKAFYVWCRKAPYVKENPHEMFAKCLVLPGSNETVFKLRQVEPEDSEEFETPRDQCYNCNSSLDPMSCSDIGMIPHTNDPCVLDFMRQRLSQEMIFVTADPLLAVLNPFKNTGNATDEVILQYRDCSDLSRLPPHTFGIARNALENLHSVRKSQTIIVSGESGAGKTEAVKQAMRFFAAAKSGKLDFKVQKAIMAANPVLEAFGNAKTIRNNNSSRFGRFMQMQVAQGGGIEFGSVKGFLLEKSRIICQEDTERSYHIFYQLLKGASPAMRTQFKLLGISDYKYINPKCLDADGIDDLHEWADVLESFDAMLLSTEERDSVLSIISGVILLGNVIINGVSKAGIDNAGEIDPASEAQLKEACDLLFIDADLVREGILVKISVAGGNEIRGTWKQDEAEMLKASLAKAMFDSTFQWIIRKLNSNIEPPEWKHHLCVLDIFGFEVFRNNSLEQLFINVTNEMLQKNFTDTVFEKESKLYREEGIPASDLVFTSNAEVIQVLTGKKGSLMSTLEDQCLAPGGTDEKLLAAVYSATKDCDKVYPAKVASHQNFIVVHTIGDIQYLITGFLFKNKDVLRGELIEVIQASPNCVSGQLFAGVSVEKGKSAKGQLIGSQFLNQLNALMELINATEAHFIRCVKPNEEKLPLKFTPAKVLIQLQSLSILEALQLKNLGYAYRRLFQEFLFQYRFVNLGVAEDTSLNPAVAAEKMCSLAKVPDSEWKIGKTMLFMKPEGMKQMARAQREALAAWEPIVAVVESLWQRQMYKRAYLLNRQAVVRSQALVRRYESFTAANRL